MKVICRLIFVLVCASTLFLNAQTYSSSISQENYYKNPHQYLAGLDTGKIGGKILVDRSLHKGEVFWTNGVSKVTTIDYSDYYQIYSTIKNSYEDTSSLIGFEKLLSISNDMYSAESINLISLLDFSFQSIDSNAIARGDFIEGLNSLTEANSTSASYVTNRVVAFSCFKYNLYGDEIKYFIPDGFLLNNHDSLNLLSVEMDFGNGEGYKTIIFDSPMLVHYSGASGFIEMKMRINYQNRFTLNESSVYAHTSVYRKSRTIPSVKRIKTFNSQNIISNGDVTSEEAPIDIQFYYPEKYEVMTLKYMCLLDLGITCAGIVVPDYKEVIDPYAFDVTIVFNDNNTSKKLRKPFVMVDGFDPGNHRNYYETIKTAPWNKLLEKEKDVRGLYELLDGQYSPWDLLDDYDNPKTPQEEEPEMVNALREEGFDLVFVNFVNGSGDINANALAFRNFLNEVLNSDVYRDNKTEEIVLVGPSMGGLITRMALAEMELNGEEHFVKSWVSFDSPHTGANIPIGLQNAMNYMSKSSLPAINKSAKKAMNAINSDAARQLFHQHHESTSQNGFNSDPLHEQLIKKMNRLSFPKVSKNYAITNGSNQPLYSSNISNIADLQVFPNVVDAYVWTQVSPVVSSIEVIGEDREVINGAKSNSLQIENAPGGWHGALYSFNKNKSNKNLDALKGGGIQYDKASFIPTSSSFGMPLSVSTIQQDWTNYASLSETNNRSRTVVPFDEIMGMTGGNQEHVSISPITKNRVIQWVVNDFEKSSRPYNRVDVSGQWEFANEVINQTASRPVAYLAEDQISFGGNGNTFEFKNGADANIAAGSTIEFLVGFKTSLGAKMIAKIQKIDRGSTLRKGSSENSTTQKGEPFTSRSLYLSRVHDYSKGKFPEDVYSMKINIGPNPVVDQLFISVDGNVENEGMMVDIIAASGKVVFSKEVFVNEIGVNFEGLSKGVYFVAISTNGSTFKEKVVKL